MSRITVREAINKLVQEGYLDRRQGKGTYVVHQKLRRNIAKVYSFSSDMRQLGLEPRPACCRCGWRKPRGRSRRR